MVVRKYAEADMPTDQGAVDVVVVGSGGAGLTAALAAAAAGTEVAVLEASARWGGTTAVSGGQVWVPNNHHMAEVGVADSVDDALSYCLDRAPGRDRALIETFVRAAPAMVRFVEAHTPIRFTPMHYPDSFAERPGGKLAGRNLEVAPIEVGDADSWQEELWQPPYPAVLTNDEIFGLGLTADPRKAPIEVIKQRAAAGQVTLGVGLIAGLLRGCGAMGVELVGNCPVRHLLRDKGGTVVGVEAERDGATWRLEARRGVVLANGGFEWDSALATRLLGVPRTHPLSPPVNRGDGLRLAVEAGAELAYPGESWCWPAIQVPGETWSDSEARPRPRLVMGERSLPHVIWVNRAGRRFVNEASHNCALAFADLDPETLSPRNVPAWAVGDAQFRRRYPVAGVMPGQPTPLEWLPEATSVADLAGAIGIEAAALENTVARFNYFARAGLDEDFGRGEAAYDRYLGDHNAPHPSLGTIEEPPFFALPIHPGTIGTKGGPRTDIWARVLGWDGTPVAGLYAAGNAMAATIGPGTIAAGLSLGLALTWGWVAGTVAAGTGPDMEN
jgi:succinate dehydrogenase/fumarate reductase flavoprotein subunit